MDAYLLFPRSKEAREVGAYEEQEEDIGCASESESSARNTIESSSSCSSELADDATSSSSSSLDRFEMSSLMTQLPFKRGLSKFFDGKSQSFASLAAVRGLEDLEKPPQKRLKPSRSYGVGLDARRRSFSRRGPNAPGSGGKKAPRGPLSMLGAAPRQRTRLPMVAPVPARTEGVTGQALLFA